MMKRLLTISAVCLLCAISAVAQIVNPVKWTSAVRLTDATHGIVSLTATIDDGWHMYSTEAVADGPVPTSVDWKELKGVKLDGGLVADHKPQRHHDPNFDLDLSWWTGRVTLSQRFTVTGSDYSIKGVVGYMSCNDTQCSSPAKEPFAFSGKGGAAARLHRLWPIRLPILPTKPRLRRPNPWGKTSCGLPSRPTTVRAMRKASRRHRCGTFSWRASAAASWPSSLRACGPSFP